MNKYYPEVYSHIVSTFGNIKEGKRYGSFYKIPILYALTIDQLVYWGAYQDIIDKTINIFSEICDFYNDIIYAKVPHEYLKEKTLKEKAMFSLKDFLGIGNKTLDINYDIESLITRLNDDYPDIFKVSNASPVFTLLAQQLGDTNNMPLDFDVLRDNYNLEIEKSDEVWYQSMFWAESTKDFKKASTINTFFSLTKPNAYDWDFLNSANQLPSISYTSIANEWVKSLVINEAIRYSLTGNSDLYTEKQLEYLESLGFMVPKSSQYKFDRTKYDDNLNYMRELYNLNDTKIENIFYIILAIYNNTSKDSLRKIFGEPKKYDDQEFRNKIFSKFWKEIVSDSDKLVRETDNVFTMEMTSIGYNARFFDFCPWFDELRKNEKEFNLNEEEKPNENIQTVKEFPKAKLNDSSSSDWKFESSKKVWDGKPFLELKENEDGKLKISIPNPNLYLKPYE
ncbi:MAG: hypothetical protein K2I49_02045, partial [Ureaplasma sp.]|nr:hypothetical protein [Ureaplasma sp.]